jgi:CRISPR-associated protein Cas5d
MGYGIRLLVRGDYACYTRPEFKSERVSYDVITPSAARGILEAVLWKPAIRWVVDRISVLNPIVFDSIRRNELGSKIPPNNVTAAMRGGKDLHQYINDDRQQRATLLLTNVAYIIEGHFVMNKEKAGEADTPEKFYNMFVRRARQGQCFHTPYLGCREFAAHFKLIEGDGEPESYYKDEAEIDLGWMLWDIEYKEEANKKKTEYSFTPKFFRAYMRHGVIEVPKEVNI